MEAFLDTLGQFIQDNQVWALPIAAALTFAESLVLVGLLVPATAIMLLIGGLAGAGLVDPAPVVAGAILGAILGDVVSYEIGRRLGPGIVHRRPLRRYRHAVARTRLFFRRYGFAAVFFGRFLGPIRSTVPLVAGMMSMSQIRFQIANVGSAVVWAPVMLAPGYLGARGAEEVGLRVGEGATGMLAVLAAVLVATLVVTLVVAKPFLEGRRARGRRARPVRAPARP